MEKYLDRCLSSLMICVDLLEKLEVLVIIDGSTDRSSEIAHNYENRYPNVFKVVDKENGNYGSCINCGLKLASGRYIKVLDADDWFDTDVFHNFMNELIALEKKKKFPDVIQMPFTSISHTGIREVIRYNTMGLEPYKYGKIYNLDDIFSDRYIRFFLIHGLTYRTEMLREMEYVQMEGISYTDTEWACYPFYIAKNILFLNLKMYQYEAGRDGQTMEPSVLMKSLDQLEILMYKMVETYEKFVEKSKMSETRKSWMKHYYANRLRFLYKKYLIDMPRKDFDNVKMDALDKNLATLCQRNGFEVSLFPENRIIRIDYIRYWRKHHHRWPLWLEKTNNVLDNIARWLYVRIVRCR